MPKNEGLHSAKSSRRVYAWSSSRLKSLAGHFGEKGCGRNNPGPRSGRSDIRTVEHDRQELDRSTGEADALRLAQDFQQIGVIDDVYLACCTKGQHLRLKEMRVQRAEHFHRSTHRRFEDSLVFSILNDRW